MTLAELKTLIQNYVQNSETTFVATLDDFIKIAEDRIFELVQFDFFRKNVTGHLTTGNTYLTAPSDFKLSFSLAVIDGNGEYHYLDKKHPSFMREYVADPTAITERSRPKYYGDFDKELSTGSNNGSTLIVSPVPDQEYDVELHYLYEPNSLTLETTGTWISDNATNALLYGSLVEAYTFMKGDADMMKLYENRFNLEILRLKNQAEARGRKDEYRYDSLRTSVS
tara:strand:- start:1358 stop:2032 length:675 start_codon:yes stop_codon:yes gene_type:complete